MEIRAKNEPKKANEIARIFFILKKNREANICS